MLEAYIFFAIMIVVFGGLLSYSRYLRLKDDLVNLTALIKQLDGQLQRAQRYELNRYHTDQLLPALQLLSSQKPVEPTFDLDEAFDATQQKAAARKALQGEALDNIFDKVRGSY